MPEGAACAALRHLFVTGWEVSDLSKLELRLEPKQALRMSPQLIQATRMLVMPAHELSRYLQDAAENNPMLEQTEHFFSSHRQEGGFLSDAAPVREEGGWDAAMTSLTASLVEQLHRRRPDQQTMALCRYLMELLDENGYLDEEDLRALHQLDIDPQLIRRALSLLQSLEPAGIGARSVEECLLLQLYRRRPRDTAAEQIVSQCLPLLADRRYHAIAQRLSLPESEVRRACDLIRQLDPHPGADDSPAETPACIIPDVMVDEDNGQWQVLLNDRYLPQFSISPSYLRLLESTEDQEAALYLKEKLRQAQWVLSCLEKRQATVRACADLILRTQIAFFRGDSPHLLPMTMREAAGHMQVHESTVGRCVKGKYLQCRQGMFPLRYFFSGQVNSCSAQALRTEIRALICAEDARKPLSDRAIACLLAEKGMDAARRTVTKYRESMHIPPACRRRQP